MKPDSEAVRKAPDQVESMFDKMAPRYDMFNHLFSLGLDFTWRKKAVAALSPNVEGDIFDGATGTGDVAIALARAYPDRKVIGGDFSDGMLAIGRTKASKQGLSDRVDLVHADLTELPFSDGRFAAATVSFGIRNVNDRQLALMELRRILKPGGRLLILDFNMPKIPIFSTIYRLYFRYFMPNLAGLFGLGPTYRYLFESVDAFPPPPSFVKKMQRAGFESISATPLTLGTVVLYIGDVAFDDIPDMPVAGE